MKRLAPLALSSLLLASTQGCKTPSSTIDVGGLDSPAEPDGRKPGSEAAETVEALPVEHPADLLPDDALLLVEVSDPPELLAYFDPLRQIPDFELIWSQLVGPIGADPLSPGDWAKLGLDIDGPVGGGLLEAPEFAAFAYVTTKDAQLFEESVMRVLRDTGGQSPAVSDVGLGRVMRLESGLSLVLRENVAMFVVADHPEQLRRDYTAMAATLDPRESLGRTELFGWSRDQLGKEDDGMIFVNVPEVLAAIEADQSGDDYSVRYLEDEIDAARRRGADAEEIRMLEERLAEERNWQAERQRERAGERALVRELFGPMEVALISGDLQSGGIQAQARVRMGPESLLRRVFTPMANESPLLRGLDQELLMLQEGQVDVTAALELFDMVLRTEGENLQALNAEAKSEIGVDFLADIFPALRGDAGLAVTLDGAPNSAKLGEIPKQLGGGVYVGLRDPAAITAALDGLARNKAMGGVLKAKRGRWQLNVPDWRRVELAIVGDHLLLTTDPGLISRTTNAQPGAQAETLASADHPARGSQPTPAFRSYWSWKLISLVETNEPWEQKPEDFLYGIDDHHTLSPDEAAKVPHSRKFKARNKEFLRALDELNRVNRKQASQRFENQYELAELMGDFGVQLGVVSDGLRADMRWRYPNAAPPFATAAQAYMNGRIVDYDEYDRAQTAVWDLRQQLIELRQEELDAHMRKTQK